MNALNRIVRVVDPGASDVRNTRASVRKWPISYRSVEFLSLAADAFAIMLSCVISGGTYHLVAEGRITDLSEYAGSVAVVSVLFCSLMKSRGLYDPSELLDFKLQIRQLSLAWLSVFLFLAGVVFTLQEGKDFSRGANLSFAALGLVSLVLLRLLWRELLRYGVAERKFTGRNIVLITTGDLHADHGSDPLVSHGYRLQRQFTLPDQDQSSRRLDETIGEIIKYVRETEVEEVVLSADLKYWPEIGKVLSKLRVLPLPVNLIPIGATSQLFKRPSHAIGDAVCIELHRRPLDTFERFVKRAFDIAFAATGLLLLLPLLIITAAAIKLDSSGPILFRQRRCGFNQKPFRIFKFRTMSVMEDSDLVCQAERSDDRVTRLGWWLRRTSIDELPQLLNVLNGSMSLVGPRPHALAHDNRFDQAVSKYAFRHHVKPGLTGWAQVNGFRGPTPNLSDIERRVEFDLWYIDNWSFTLDCLIILRTFIEVARSRNAF